MADLRGEGVVLVTVERGGGERGVFGVGRCIRCRGVSGVVMYSCWEMSGLCLLLGSILMFNYLHAFNVL